MWREPLPFCPDCDEKLEVISLPYTDHCNICGDKKVFITCLNKTCRFQRRICVSCNLNNLHVDRKYKPESASVNSDNDSLNYTISYTGIFALVILVAAILWYSRSSKGVENISLLENLRKDFPSQPNETWYNVLSVLEKEFPAVKSITFLHAGDKRTSDCLTSKLVTLYSGNKNLKSGDVTFSASGYEERDYGFALEHYRSVVEKFRVFVTDLTTVPGNIARIFHSLCDDVSSDIKPSLFIFTLKYDTRTERLKPMKRAETILKEAWSDLPDNEIYPLLARVVKNVVDVVPEKHASC